jgi:predicted acetyltransferase
MNHYLKAALIAVVAVAITKRVQGMIGVQLV